MTPRRKPNSTPLIGRLALRRDREGIAVLVVVLMTLAVAGLATLTIFQGRDHFTREMVLTDSVRALDAADACAAGALKVLPRMLDYYVTMLSQGQDVPLVHQQFDPYFFGDQFGADDPRWADCVVQIVEIADDLPAPGYSEGGGCFKRITLRSTATVARTTSTQASADISQNQIGTTREVIVRGAFGPTTCN